MPSTSALWKYAMRGMTAHKTVGQPLHRRIEFATGYPAKPVVMGIHPPDLVIIDRRGWSMNPLQRPPDRT